MANKIGSLEIDLLAKMDQMQATLGKAKNEISSFKENATHALEAIGVMWAAEKVTEYVKEVAEASLQQLKFAETLDISFQGFQKLTSASKASEVQSESLQKAIAFMTKTWDSDKMQSAVKKLGLSYAELSKMPVDERFMKIEESLGKVKNATERATLASTMFKRSWQDMSALSINENFQNNYKKAEELGVGKVSTAQMENLHKVDINLGLLKDSIAATALTIMTNFTPAIVQVTNALMYASSIINKWFNNDKQTTIGGSIFSSIADPINRFKTLIPSMLMFVVQNVAYKKAFGDSLLAVAKKTVPSVPKAGFTVPGAMSTTIEGLTKMSAEAEKLSRKTASEFIKSGRWLEGLGVWGVRFGKLVSRLNPWLIALGIVLDTKHVLDSIAEKINAVRKLKAVESGDDSGINFKYDTNENGSLGKKFSEAYSKFRQEIDTITDILSKGIITKEEAKKGFDDAYSAYTYNMNKLDTNFGALSEEAEKLTESFNKLKPEEQLKHLEELRNIKDENGKSVLSKEAYQDEKNKIYKSQRSEIDKIISETESPFVKIMKKMEAAQALYNGGKNDLGFDKSQYDVVTNKYKEDWNKAITETPQYKAQEEAQKKQQEEEKRQMEKLQSDADSLYQSSESPLQRINDDMQKAAQLFHQGFLTAQQYMQIKGDLANKTNEEYQRMNQPTINANDKLFDLNNKESWDTAKSRINSVGSSGSMSDMVISQNKFNDKMAQKSLDHLQSIQQILIEWYKETMKSKDAYQPAYGNMYQL